MKRITNKKEYEIIHHYLMKEPYCNTYIFGDIEKFSLNSDIVSIYCNDITDIKVVLMKFIDDFVVYSYKNDFDAEIVASFIRNRMNFETSISGKGATISKINKMLELPVRKTNLLNITSETLKDSVWSNEYQVTRICEEKIMDIIDIYREIDEFKGKYRDIKTSREKIKSFLETGRMIAVYYNEKVIATVCSTAESSVSSMLVNICTRKHFRGKGIASYLVYTILKELLVEKENVCLYVDNPIAMRIYCKLGFYKVADYAILSQYKENV